MSALAYALLSAIARLTAAIGAAPLLAPTFHLYQNDFTPDENTLLTDLVECDFTGYVAVAVAFGAVGIDGNGLAVAPAAVSWTTTDAVSQPAYGIFVKGSTGLLVCAGRLDDAPYIFTPVGKQLNGTVLFGLSNGTFTVAIGP